MRSEAAVQLVSVAALLIGLGLHAPAAAQEYDTDPASGLIRAEGWELVIAHCSACHSINLVRQNRGDGAHWLKLIRWMQDKHNLWDLGPAEEPIVAYLAEHYAAPEVVPRRQLLETSWLEGTAE